VYQVNVGPKNFALNIQIPICILRYLDEYDFGHSVVTPNLLIPKKRIIDTASPGHNGSISKILAMSMVPPMCQVMTANNAQVILQKAADLMMR
jgi:hypothetical protein